MALYDKYLRLKIDRSLIGLENKGDFYPYFCTPKGADIIGWAGVDGNHYCFVRGFGEIVFAVNPSNLPGDQVHPLAQNFEEFLRLLLTCGDLAAIEQAHMWEKDQFDTFLAENQPTSDQKKILHLLEEKLELKPMERPFEYIKALQKSFDYTKIKYRPEYYEAVGVEEEDTEWKVYFESGFWKHHGRDRAADEIAIGKQFTWYKGQWNIPAVYVCKAGLVVDYLLEAEPDRVKKFVERWEAAEADSDRLSQEHQNMIESENPLHVDFRSDMILNGIKLQCKSGYSMVWIPDSCRPKGTRNETEWQKICQHYQLDTKKGWAIHRISYAWDFKRKPAIRSLCVHLEQRPVSVVGYKFRTPRKEKRIVFTHPATGTDYVITIQNTEKRQLDAEKLHSEEYEYPTHYTMMTYSFSSKLPNNEFMICDCQQSDAPKKKVTGDASGVCSIGIIGGAAGPTAVFVAEKHSELQVHSACSALYFEPVDEIEWQIVYMIKMYEDTEITLIG